MLLAEKERQIGEQEEELRRLNQLLSAKERELHSVQSTIAHREREKAVSCLHLVISCVDKKNTPTVSGGAVDQAPGRAPPERE